MKLLLRRSLRRRALRRHALRPMRPAAQLASHWHGHHWRRHGWRRQLSRIVASGFFAVLATGISTAAIAAVDPDAPEGVGAITNILSERGVQVHAVQRDEPLPDASDTTIVLDQSYEMWPASIVQQLGRSRADLVLLRPTDSQLRQLQLPVSFATYGSGSEAVAPGCTDEHAQAAKSAMTGGDYYALRATPKSSPRAAAPGTSGSASSAPLADLVTTAPTTREFTSTQTCYPNPSNLDSYGMIALQQGERRITIVGNSFFLTNQHLAQEGNAALAVRLLARHGNVHWYPMIRISSFGGGDNGGQGGGGGGQGSGSGQEDPPSVFPPWVKWVIIQLLLTSIALVIWRARRLGALVAERMPAIVRAIETHRGRGRLYQRRGTRDHVAAVLRTASARRIAALLGTPQVSLSALASSVATVTATPLDTVQRTLSGPAPQTDAELHALATSLDSLEHNVRTASGYRRANTSKDDS